MEKNTPLEKLAKLVLVVPVYNEEEILRESNAVLEQVLVDLIAKHKISDNSKILYVNDGSRDSTWNIILDLQQHSTFVTGVCFTRNFGQQNAALAGLHTASQDADIMVTIDADLQDDVNVIEEMVDQYYDGCDIVLGVRNNRDTDSAFKRLSAAAFYKIMTLLGIPSVPNHSEFRLISARAVQAVEQYPERNMFLRCVIQSVGYKVGQVFYSRKARIGGESKYSVRKLIGLAFQGITSFSVVPLKMIMYFGMLTLLISFCLFVYSIYRAIIGTTSGWPSLMVSIWFLGGGQLIAISIIGEYLGKVYTETKHRPRYFVLEDTYTPTIDRKSHSRTKQTER